MNQVTKMNLPIVGRIQHGEQQTLKDGKTKVVELKHFIAKIRDIKMQYILNRFDEKFRGMDSIPIRFFDEEPLSVKRVRYNTAGAVCYCLENQVYGKQRISKVWQPIECKEDCQYRISDNGFKPLCNCEGTLKFMIPEVSTDRVWIMKITGQTSIKRLKEYINLQKQLGNSLIGDYTLFLREESQTNQQGKTFNNYILDIIKKEDFSSDNQIPNNQTKPIIQPVQKQEDAQKEVQKNNTIQKPVEQKQVQNVTKSVAPNATKVTENKTVSNKTPKSKKKEDVKKDAPKVIEQPKNVAENENKYENHYLLVDTSTTILNKAGKPTEYLVGNFVNESDEITSVLIPPQLKDELMTCDTGTEVVLDLVKAGDKTFTNSIKYVQKCIKKSVA